MGASASEGGLSGGVRASIARRHSLLIDGRWADVEYEAIEPCTETKAVAALL